MPVFTGAPSHKNRVGYTLGLIFFVIAAVAATVLLVMTFAPADVQPRMLLRWIRTMAYLRAALLAVIMTSGVVIAGITVRLRKAKKELPLDQVLGRLPDNCFVFCGRPWTGEAAERETGNYDWAPTDSAGRSLAGLSTDRLVLGPGGVWFIGTQGKSGDAHSKAAARAASLELQAYLRKSERNPETAAKLTPRPLLSHTHAGTVDDISSGKRIPLNSLVAHITSAPPLLSAEEQGSLVFALASLYSGPERAAALSASKRVHG